MKTTTVWLSLFSGKVVFHGTTAETHLVLQTLLRVHALALFDCEKPDAETRKLLACPPANGEFGELRWKEGV